MKDRTGESVTVTLDTDRPISAFTVHLADGPAVGRADFLDVRAEDGAAERIFFHTEVDEEYGGRGLAGILLREALADSIREHLVVVPVCPFFAAHLKKHGDEFVADGGAFRDPARPDIVQVSRAVRAGRAPATEA